LGWTTEINSIDMRKDELTKVPGTSEQHEHKEMLEKLDEVQYGIKKILERIDNLNERPSR